MQQMSENEQYLINSMKKMLKRLVLQRVYLTYLLSVRKTLTKQQNQHQHLQTHRQDLIMLHRIKTQPLHLFTMQW